MKATSFTLFAFLCISPGFGALSKTYPTAATTQLRWDAYNDSINTIYRSTWTVSLSTWTMLGATITYIDSNIKFNGPNKSPQIVGFIATPNYQHASTSTLSYFVSSASWSLQDYTKLVVQETQKAFIFNIANNDMEQYMVWGDTNTKADSQWQGWCLSFVGKTPVYIVCPK